MILLEGKLPCLLLLETSSSMLCSSLGPAMIPCTVVQHARVFHPD